MTRVYPFAAAALISLAAVLMLAGSASAQILYRPVAPRTGVAGLTVVSYAPFYVNGVPIYTGQPYVFSVYPAYRPYGYYGPSYATFYGPGFSYSAYDYPGYFWPYYGYRRTRYVPVYVPTYYPVVYLYPVYVPLGSYAPVQRGYAADEGGQVRQAGAAPVKPADSKPAFIQVLLPDPAAEVWFEGTKTEGQGTSRLFESPPLQPGRAYAYRVKASWDRGGQKVTEERVVDVSAGTTYVVDFTRPK
jgi:uncharacterized protein (TIGR03000 family)